MPNPNNFDEASAATEELFNNEQVEIPTEEAPAGDAQEVADGADGVDSAAQEETQQTDNPPAETVPAEENTDNQNQVLDDAVNTAEAAAQAAAQKDTELRQALAEVAALRQQVGQLQGTIEEMSEKTAENIVEEALTPPTLDMANLAFDSEEEQKAAMAKYAEELSAYNRQELLKELKPMLEYAKRGMRDAEAKEAVSALSQVPELAGITEMLPQLEQIIANNKWLQSDEMPLEEKYINAYAIAKGIASINNPPVAAEPPKELTPEELLEKYNNNPAFQELVEKQRLEALKGSQQVPPFSASSGAAGAALDIKEKPKDLEEASRRTRQLLGEM